jgi:TolB-like protein
MPGIGETMTAGAGGASDHGEPEVAAVRAQLDRILDSPGFRATPKRRALLRHLVEETLAGRGELLKGFTIAVAVFDRDASFDSQTDPVVRLEARRLRTEIDAYYGTAGAGDPLQISIPKGHYRPTFAWRAGAPAPAAPPAPPRAEAPPSPVRARLRLALFGLALVLAAAGGWLLNRSVSRPAPETVAGRGAPSVVVLPFQTLTSGEEARLLAAGITEDVVVGLMRFPGLRLYSVGPDFQQAGGDPKTVGRDLGAQYVVRGSLRSSGETVRIVVQLDDVRSGEVIWSERYDGALEGGGLLAAQAELADRIAAQLGQAYGAVDVAAGRLPAEDAASLSTPACVLRAHAWRRTRSAALHGPALACLEEAVRRDLGSADAWAMLGWLRLDAARMELIDPAEAPAAMETARAAASRAVEIDDANPRALQALAAVEFHRGAYAESERLQRAALAVNPHDPEALAQLGWRLALRGRFDEGLPYLREAIDRSLSPPGWYFQPIAIQAYLEGDYRGAIDAAERASGSGIGLSLVAMSRAKLGDRAAAQAALDAMAEASPLLARDPATAYRLHQAEEAIVSALVRGLRAAGWREQADPSAQEVN